MIESFILTKIQNRCKKIRHFLKWYSHCDTFESFPPLFFQKLAKSEHKSKLKHPNCSLLGNYLRYIFPQFLATLDFLLFNPNIEIPISAHLEANLNQCNGFHKCICPTCSLMDNGHVMRVFFKNIPNNWPILVNGPNELWGYLGVLPGEVSAHISSFCVPSP